MSTDETYWQNANQVFIEGTKTLYSGAGYLPETLGEMGIINIHTPGIRSSASVLAALIGQNVLMEFTAQDNPLNEYIHVNGELISKREQLGGRWESAGINRHRAGGESPLHERMS